MKHINYTHEPPPATIKMACGHEENDHGQSPARICSTCAREEAAIRRKEIHPFVWAITFKRVSE